MNLKNFITISTILMPLLLLSCFDYDSPKFEVVESFKLRVVGSTLESGPNCAPGDTVNMKLYFAGDEVTSIGKLHVLNGPVWVYKNGKNVQRTDYDTVTVNVVHSWLPDSVELSLVLDSAVIHNNRKHTWITDTQWGVLDVMRKENKESNGASVAAMTAVEKDSLEEYLRRAYLSVHVFAEATSELGKKLTIKKEIPVTFSKEFPTIMPLHKNAECNWIAVYGMPSSMEDYFQPHSDASVAQVEKNYLYHRTHPDSVASQIPIRVGWSYFLAADADLDNVKKKEFKDFTWFIENVDKVYDKPESLMVFYDDYDEEDFMLTPWNDVKKFLPPKKKDMKRFKVWVNVTYGNRHLQSQVMRSGEGVFVYE